MYIRKYKCLIPGNLRQGLRKQCLSMQRRVVVTDKNDTKNMANAGLLSSHCIGLDNVLFKTILLCSSYFA